MQLPPSKSVAARKLVMDFIAGGCKPLAAELPDDADCGDISVLAAALSRGVPAGGVTVSVEASGTAFRLLTALYACCEGCSCRLTGTDRLRERPIAPLVDALRIMGADIQYTVREGFAPLLITGRKLRGGEIELDASTSSQYATALMLAAPLMANPLKIKYKIATASGPYVKLTAAMMRHRGVGAEADAEGVFVDHATYSPGRPRLERDWSAASFWYEIVAVSAGWATLPHLDPQSQQPDRRAAELFEMVGAVTEFTDEGAELSATPDLFSFLDVDLQDTPDLVPPLAAAACLVGIPFRFSGVAQLRIKESDRLAALRDELAKIGCVLTIEQYDNVLAWDGTRTPIQELPVFDSHNDHRIAMAMAAAAIFLPGIVIQGAECVAKSYPRFWDDLRAAGFTVVDADAPNPQTEDRR